MKKEQLAIFNDAVIAIVITLMVLDIELPELTQDNILTLARHIGIYALSFTIVAVIWLNIHIVLRPLERVGNKIIWLDLLLLFLVSLVPLPTQALGKNFQQRESHIFYGIILTAVEIAFFLLHWQAVKDAKMLNGKHKLFVLRKNWIATFLYILSIPLSFISIYLSTGIFIFVTMLYFLPAQEPSEES